MPASPHDRAILAARLDRLETTNRRLRYCLYGLLAAGASLGVTAFLRTPKVVQAERIELISAAGQRRATLEADSAAFSLMLYGTREQPEVGLGLLRGTSPRLVVLSGGGRVLASLGPPGQYPARP